METEHHRTFSRNYGCIRIPLAEPTHVSYGLNHMVARPRFIVFQAGLGVPGTRARVEPARFANLSVAVVLQVYTLITFHTEDISFQSSAAMVPYTRPRSVMCVVLTRNSCFQGQFDAWYSRKNDKPDTTPWLQKSGTLDGCKNPGKLRHT